MDVPEHTGQPAETTVPDLVARRPDVLRRLLERGVPPQALRTILPDWGADLALALTSARSPA